MQLSSAPILPPVDQIVLTAHRLIQILMRQGDTVYNSDHKYPPAPHRFQLTIDGIHCFVQMKYNHPGKYTSLEIAENPLTIGIRNVDAGDPHIDLSVRLDEHRSVTITDNTEGPWVAHFAQMLERINHFIDQQDPLASDLLSMHEANLYRAAQRYTKATDSSFDLEYLDDGYADCAI